MQPGTQLGHYEILEAIGKGGMGEVWKAKDTKLGREVAIKTLPPEFAQDADRLARFEREAKLLASLNHPNIAAIYGLEEHEGSRFLVLELVEGDTLADRLKRGAIPVEESLKLALQIAEALEAAHEKGVIHRDLKPANIKVTPDGKVKVLDFGLAKAFAGEQPDANLSNSPTLSMQATQAGIILGTAAYMSPEQARGETADKRADVWAFGCVLFEMLTGRGTFDGKTVSDVLAGVLRSDPEWNRLPSNLHPRVRVLLERSLEKEAKDRLSGISDARVEIQKVLADSSGVMVQPVADVVQAARQSKLPWVAAIVLAAGAAGVAGWWFRPEEPRHVSRTVIPLAETDQFPTQGCPGPRIALSPDGTLLAYTANDQLYVRQMDDFQARVLGETDGARSPFFSPDGEWIGFWADGVLKKVTTSGGTPQTLTAAGGCFGSWAGDDTILFGTGAGQPIARVSAEGGDPELLQDSGGVSQLLPGGDAFLLATGGEIVVQGLDGSGRKVLLAGSHARYVPTGHLIYATPTTPTLMAVPFDLDALELVGNPVPMVEGVEMALTTQTYHFSVSDSGTLAYLPGDAPVGGEPEGVLVLVDRNGDTLPLDVEPASYRSPRFSPDGMRVAVEVIDDTGQGHIWIYDLSGNSDIRQLTQTGNNTRPVWTPDGQRVTFGSERDGSWGIYERPADGSTLAERLTTAESERRQWPDSWHPDGETLVFADASMTNALWDLWTYSRDSDSTDVFAGGPDNQMYAAFSPGGEWVAYTQTGDPFGVRVQPFPPTEVVHQITTSGETGPVWTAAGDELFFRTGFGIGAQFSGMEVTTDGAFTFRNQRTLPIEGAPTFQGYRDYDVLPDGERFVMIYPEGELESVAPARPQINIVQNWFTELRERVPVN